MAVRDLGELPREGIHLDLDELVVVVDAVRALIDGSSADEPNRAHIMSIAFVIARAVDRAG